MSYEKFTEEQFKRANSVDLVKLLRSMGEDLIKSGREWRWREHDSVTVNGNKWYRHSNQHGGYPLKFLQEFFDYTFVEAMHILLEAEENMLIIKKGDYSTVTKKEFIAPEKSKERYKRLYAYLIKQRFIDSDVITAFVRDGSLYQDAKYNSIIFAGRNDQGEIRHAQSISPNPEKKFKQTLEGSNFDYCFRWIGISNRVYAFESPIDMLSFITINKNNWQDHTYVSLCGVSSYALINVLKTNQNISDVYLALDCDIAGDNACERINEEIIYNFNFVDIRFERVESEFKDWNEDLKAINGVEAIPRLRNPAIMIYEQYLKKFQQIKYDYVSKHLLQQSYNRLINIDINDVDNIKDSLIRLGSVAISLQQKVTQSQHPP